MATSTPRDDARLRSEAAFHAIASIASDAIIMVDADQVIIFFNAGAEEIFGYDAEEVIGRPLDVLLPERYHAVHRRHVEEFGESVVAARRMGERSAIVGRRRSGEEFPAEASIVRIELDGERVYSVVLRDVTERRRDERLKDVLAEAGSIFAASLDLDETLASVARLAVDHLGDWCIIYARDDDGEIRRTGAAHTDPERQPLLEELQRFRLDPAGPHPASAAIETGEPQRLADIDDAFIDEVTENADHARVLRELGLRAAVAVPMVDRGRTFGALALYSSTDANAFGDHEVRLAQELGVRAALALDNARLYEEATRALKAREEVLRVVSHELGNPLSAIFVGLKLVARTLPRADEEARDAVEMIRESAGQLRRLIDDLLEVQRIEAGRLTVEPRELPLRSIVDRAVQQLEPLAEGKSIRLTASLPDDPPSLLADGDRLLQVFQNLVGNAVKFTSRGGDVRITAEVDGDGRGEGGRVVIAVADTGIGIPADGLPHVFDRFWQAERHGRHGAGLGLSIVKGIVEAHGGEIWVESEEGEGATFRFSVPVAKQSPCADAG
ncbi:MAG: ATP-binding protein [Gemmatimonadota bacterium]